MMIFCQHCALDSIELMFLQDRRFPSDDVACFTTQQDLLARALAWISDRALLVDLNLCAMNFVMFPLSCCNGSNLLAQKKIREGDCVLFCHLFA